MDGILTWLSDNLYWIVLVLLPIVIPLALFQVLPVLVLMERRGAAFIQDRIGPHRAGVNINAGALKQLLKLRMTKLGPIPNLDAAGLLAERPTEGVRMRMFGMLYNAADLVKILFKEHFVAPFADRFFYKIAPAIPIAIALVTTGLVPWFAPFTYQTSSGGFLTVVGQAIDAHSGLLALFALSSLGVYGVVLGSWASNSKYALLGGMRSSAMMISYEVSMGLSILGLLLLYGTFSLTDAVEWQTQHAWGVVVQPIAFVLFLVAMFAEANRNPFDVAEGESEIVAGFHTEFNGIRFMLYMTAEYFHVLMASVLIAILFFGGWDLLPVGLPLHGFDQPWVTLDSFWLRDNLGLVISVSLVPLALLLAGFAAILLRRRTHYARGPATDKAIRCREYAVYAGALTAAAIGALAGAAVAWTWDPAPVAMAGNTPVFSNLVNIVTAIVQVHVVLVKALAFCWLFVWVRWTLPRFRYDQIMALGWKVLLNIALVNLLVTAVIAKLVRG
jgi:NADH-quinone oxidoreductase subunit H